MKKIAILVLTVAVLVGVGTGYGAAAAPEDIGSVVALRGVATIARDAKLLEAKLKDGIQLRDTVETRDASRTKMLFIDDSVLTLGEKARVVIREFIYSKDKRGRSIFNLIDGKLRSVVGKSEFEVHTPTAVAAARGTVFECETGQLQGRPFTTCTAFEGSVDIRSIDPSVTGRVTLRPGMTITVTGNQPLPAPVPAPAAAVQTTGTAPAAAAPSLPLTQAPPVNMTPPQPHKVTPVNIGIRFP